MGWTSMQWPGGLEVGSCPYQSPMPPRNCSNPFSKVRTLAMCVHVSAYMFLNMYIPVCLSCYKHVSVNIHLPFTHVSV